MINIYAIIILATLIGAYILEITSDMLNLRALGADLPLEFEGIYDADKYNRSQDYTRVKTRFGLVTGLFDIVVFLAFWFFGGFNSLDLLVRNLGLNSVLTGLIYIAILISLKFIISIPFSLYSTFFIEERFGFNKTKPITFWMDLIKAILLSVLLGGPLLTAILLFFEYMGGAAWAYTWGVATVFILFIQFIAPSWIMPLFNKFTPLDEGELKDAIINYAKSANFSLKNILVMDGSRRSSKSNAFFAGFGRNRRIALFDTLISAHTNNELVAILAHEIGHYKKKHILQTMIISIVHIGIIFFLLSIFVSRKGLFDAFYMNNISVYSGLIFFGLLFSPIEFILSIGMNMLSRRNEYEADLFAAHTTGKPEDLIIALKKLSAHNLANLTPHPFYTFLNYSHPPLLKRISALREN